MVGLIVDILLGLPLVLKLFSYDKCAMFVVASPRFFGEIACYNILIIIIIEKSDKKD